MNNIALIGRLTRDAEIKTLSTGKKIANFTVAVDREYKDADGNKITDFIPCLAWSPTAELIEKYFKKGDAIGIVGRLESRDYTDKDGNHKTFYSVNVMRVDFIQGRSNTNNSAAPVAPQKKIDPNVNEEGVIEDDSLPFQIPDADEDIPF